MSSNITNNNNDCYFKVDTIIESQVTAGNVSTADVTCSTLQPQESLYVGGNASFGKEPTTVQGITNASGYELTTSQKIDIDLQNNRLSNVKRPTDNCSPVPANCLVTPEYFYTSLKEMSFFRCGTGKIPLIGEKRLSYQSKNIFNHIRFVDVDNSNKVKPGTTCIQLLSKGVYMIDFGVTKRWGWNNGFGGNVYMKDFNTNNLIISGSSVASGGGYSGQGCMGAAIYVHALSNNPDVLTTPQDKSLVIYMELAAGDAEFCSQYLGIIFYEHKV